MPLKKPVRTKKAAENATPNKASRDPKTEGGRSTWIVGVVALLLLSVAAAAMLFAAREPSPTADATVADARATATAPSPAPVKKAAKSATTAAPDAEADSATGRVSGAVEITGCVQRADSRFVLKDTEGSAAPRSRSWKSGFVKKSPASLELSDAHSAVRLADHVGQRVSVTGTLIDRQMMVQSLRRVSPSCQ